MKALFLLIATATLFSCKKECPEIQNIKPKLDISLVSFNVTKSEDTATFTITVRATAIGIDHYIGMGAGGTSAIGTTTAGFIFMFQKPDQWIDGLRTLEAPQCKTKAESRTSGIGYKVPKGKSEDFTVTVKISSHLSGQYRLYLKYVRYSFTPDDPQLLMQELDGDTMRTDYLFLQ